VTAAAPGGIKASLSASQTWPAVRLSLTGGGGRDEIDQRRDVADVRVEAWGESQTDTPTARDDLRVLVEACRDALIDTLGDYGYGMVVRSRELSGPTWAPDPQDFRPRMTWTHELTIL
jgi:hypothetical protein